MVVPSTVTASGISPTPTPLFANRFQPLEEPPSDEEDSQPQPKFRARGVYKPPHMRATPQPEPTAHDTSSVCSAYGSVVDHEKKGTPNPHTPCVDSTPGPSTLEFSEVKKIIRQELLIQRRAVERLEAMGDKLLKERERVEQELQTMKKMGVSDEEIQKILDQDNENPPSVKPLDINSLREELLRIDFDTEQDVGQLEKTPEEVPEKVTGDDPANKTSTPGGLVYSSVDHPTDIYQTAGYGHSIISAAPANNVHHDTSVCQATGWNEGAQAYPEVANLHGSVLPVTCHLPSQIYQAVPGKKFDVNQLPPRFRQPPIYYHPVLLNFQNVVPTRSMDAIPRQPAMIQPQNSTLNHTVRPVTMPPPPRPYFYEVDRVFDFEGVARSTNCNRDEFVKTYWKTNGFSPSQAAWVAWASAVERVKRAQKYELLKVMEREMKERYGAGSRLSKWCSKLLDGFPDPELGYSSASSDTSTKMESSEKGDEGSTAVSVVGPPNWKWDEMPRAQRPWKDVADKTWAFGEPPRLDDKDHYMTRIVEKMGWQVYDPPRNDSSAGE